MCKYVYLHVYIYAYLYIYMYTYVCIYINTCIELLKQIHCSLHHATVSPAMHALVAAGPAATAQLPGEGGQLPVDELAKRAPSFELQPVLWIVDHVQGST